MQGGMISTKLLFQEWKLMFYRLIPHALLTIQVLSLRDFITRKNQTLTLNFIRSSKIVLDLSPKLLVIREKMCGKYLYL